jgi:hypothetical protein
VGMPLDRAPADVLVSVVFIHSSSA